MTSREYIKSVGEMIPDDFPTLAPLPNPTNSASSASSSLFGSVSEFFVNVTWQTWVIIFLILVLLGINIFSYLAKGTEQSASIIKKVFGPILAFFGYNTLETTKQTIETTATGTKAGVDIVSGATTGAINTIEDKAIKNNSNSNSNNTDTDNDNDNDNSPKGQMAQSSQQGTLVQEQIQQTGANIDKFQEGSLEKALSNASQSQGENGPEPDTSRSSIQTTGKSGWCFIGEEQGVRTCSEVGVNDTCMSGDVFPNQAICMNPNLRA